jgi:hypothetical protein
MLNGLRRRALWVYGLGAVLAVGYVVMALFFWPAQNQDAVMFLPVLIAERIPLVPLIGGLLVGGALLYGQYNKNALYTIMLGALTVIWLLVILVVLGQRVREQNFYFVDEYRVVGQTYYLISHEPVTSRCNEEVCFRDFSLYQCDSVGIDCRLHLRDLRGAGGAIRLEAYDDRFIIFDSWQNDILAEFALP